MNVLILSTQNPYITSGIVAYNLYKGFKAQGHNTKILTRYYVKYEDKDFLSMETPLDVTIEKVVHKFKRVWARLPRVFQPKKVVTDHEYHVQDYDQTKEYFSTKRLLKKAAFKPDVVFYLFQQNFLTAKNLYEINQLTGAPIFWYLMDTAPLTGLCHYSWDCNGYTKGCGKCPALYSDDPNDQSAINLSYKQKYFDKTDIRIITPTEWQNKKAVESALYRNKPIHKVILSIDSEVYGFVSKQQGKEKLGIGVNRKVIFFGSTSVRDKRKGMVYLFEALQLLKDNWYKGDNDILLLIAGNFDPAAISLPFECKNLGLLKTSEELAAAFNASDVFVCPSIEDSGPMMINQSIMTGTPVVSFEMGVSEDIVLTGKTGYRAKLRSSSDLATGIHTILALSANEYENYCTNARQLAMSSYSFGVAADKMIKLIQTGEHKG